VTCPCTAAAVVHVDRHLAQVVLSCVLLQAGKKVGLSDDEIESFLKQIKEDAVKEKLKQTTQQALDLGVHAWTVLMVIYYCFLSSKGCTSIFWWINKVYQYVHEKVKYINSNQSAICCLCEGIWITDDVGTWAW